MDDHVLGLPGVASVVLLEYGDLCDSFCRAAYPIVKEVRRRMGDRLCFVFRHFPQVEHPQAQGAAVAAEAAAAQGNFWQMHDLFYEREADLGSAVVFGCAASLGLDMKRFRQDMRDQATAARVLRDRDAGVRAGVSATPTFFLNDKLYRETCDLSSLLDEAQREAGLR